MNLESAKPIIVDVETLHKMALWAKFTIIQEGTDLNRLGPVDPGLNSKIQSRIEREMLRRDAKTVKEIQDSIRTLGDRFHMMRLKYDESEHAPDTLRHAVRYRSNLNDTPSMWALETDFEPLLDDEQTLTLTRRVVDFTVFNPSRRYLTNEFHGNIWHSTVKEYRDTDWSRNATSDSASARLSRIFARQVALFIEGRDIQTEPDEFEHAFRADTTFNGNQVSFYLIIPGAEDDQPRASRMHRGTPGWKRGR